MGDFNAIIKKYNKHGEEKNVCEGRKTRIMNKRTSKKVYENHKIK